MTEERPPDHVLAAFGVSGLRPVELGVGGDGGWRCGEVVLSMVADHARAVGLSATSRENLSDAFDAVRKLDLDPPPRILITGSLYLAGEALRENAVLPQ